MKAEKYVLALDQGTTSSRAVLFNHDGNIIAMAQKPIEQHYPHPAWVEHDPNEIWYSQSSVAAELLPKQTLQDLTLLVSGSRINVKPPSCGIGRRPFPFIVPSCGKTDVQPIFAGNYKKTDIPI